VLPNLPRMSAVFLDVDGTLVPYAATPGAVRVDPGLVTHLSKFAAKLGGALALLSGRRLENLDELFAPLSLPAAGLHGLQRRDAAGRAHCAQSTAASLAGARAHLQALVDATPGLRFEDKIETFAVHFQSAAEQGPLVLARMNEVLAMLGPGFQVQPGRLVYELKSRLCNKGTALRAFLQETPFIGRTPVMIGDDLTDLDAFHAAEALGGYAIAVGTLVSARWHVANPQELQRWIATLAET
jgi:trehalose 6-phosphate phosphatase